MPRGLRKLFWRRFFHRARRYKNELVISFGDAGIREETAEGRYDLPWSCYTAYLDAPHYILLYGADHTFSPIPKSVLTERERIGLLELLARKVKRIG